MRGRRLAVGAFVAGVAALAGAETRPRYGNEIEASLLGAPVALDPIAAQSHAEVTVVGQVFDTLYAIGLDGIVQPHLAIGLPVIDPVRGVAHIALRRGVVFHDGSPLTAADVATSLERVRSKVGWVLAPLGAIRPSGDGIDAVLRVPGTDVAMLLALPQTAITPGGLPTSWARPIGSGPFAVASVSAANRELVLKAFDDHFAGRPYVDRLVLRWYDTPDGEARRFETGLAQLSARGAAVFAGARPKHPASQVEGPSALLLFVGFGRRTPGVTGDLAFRQALDLALDRGALSTITTGERTQATRLPLPIEAGAPRLDPAASVGDPARALALLDGAGARNPELSANGRRLVRLTIIIDDTRPDDREIALRVSRGLDKLGIGSSIEVVPAERMRARVRVGDCDLWIGQLAEPLGAATAWWGAAFAAGNDDWARAQLAAGPLDGAAAAVELARKLPIVPLMFRSLLIWHRSDVRGLGFDASGRPGFADLYWVKGKS